MIAEPLAFVLDALEAGGALASRDGEHGFAVIPPALAARLGLLEACALVVQSSRQGDVACGLGTPLLEKLVAEARAETPVTHVRLDVEPPRPAHARALAERFVLRNGLAEIAQVTLSTATYVAASVAWVAESDDRREGLVHVVVSTKGDAPDEALASYFDLAWPSALIVPSARALDARGAARWIAIGAEVAVKRAVAGVASEAERRHRRDHERIATYYADLVSEARAPRRRIDAAAIEAKVGHVLAERDAKLRALPDRFSLRVASSIAALVVAEVPCATVSLALRRRKASRDLALTVPALAESADRLPCDVCAGPTSRPAACDERMHLLCEACAPNAQGRIDCRACRRA